MVIGTKEKSKFKNNDQIKKSLYNWIMHHPQVFQSQIVNDFLKVKIDGHTEPQLVPKLLLQVSVRELRNDLVSDTDNGGLKEARYEDNNIIIIDSTLRSLLPPQLSFSSIYKVLYGCECYISAKSIHSSLLSWRDRYIKKLSIKDKILKKKSGGKANSHI